MPFGLLNYFPARILWLLLNLGLILVAAGALWKIYGGAASARWLPIVVTAAFFPAYLTLGMGQIGGVILIGLVAYLYFVQRERWWPAGAALVLVAVKPQLAYLFWVALLLWILEGRRWSLLLAGVVAGSIAWGLASLPNPQVTIQYLHAVASEPPLYWKTTTLGALLRYSLGWQKSWLQFLPSALGLAWFAFYWPRRAPLLGVGRNKCRCCCWSPS